MVVVDSSVWIDFLRGTESAQVSALEDLLRQGNVLLGDLILVEVLQGCTRASDYSKTRGILAALPMVTMGGRAVALQAAAHYRALRSRGITVRKTIDTLIAARCIADELPLLHCDRDFAPFAEHLGLHVFPAGLH